MNQLFITRIFGIVLSIITVILFSSWSYGSIGLVLQNYQGELLGLNSPILIDPKLNKKGTVLIFLSAKCPCSDAHLKKISDLTREFTDFKFYGIHSNQDETLEVSKNYFLKKEISFPILEDKNALLADKLKAFKTPHAYILNTQGEVVYQGGVTSSPMARDSDKFFLREALLDIENKRSVKNPETRTLGCSISRGDKNVF